MVSKDKSIRFKVPSSRNYYCEMQRIKDGFILTFFNVGKKINVIKIKESQVEREYLRKISIKSGIDFYALTGPYDCSDEILRQWHKHFKKKGIFRRLLEK